MESSTSLPRSLGLASSLSAVAIQADVVIPTIERAAL